MQHYTLKCQILSPIHIGTDREIEPYEYVIRGNKFHRIHLEKWLLDLSEADQQRFSQLTDKGNLGEIRKFIADHVTPEKHALYSADVSPAIARTYADKFGDLQNRLIIHPFIRTDINHVSFIPGSSLKGAIRTAVVSEKAKHSNLQQPKPGWEEFHFEEKVMNYQDAKTDPFRAIKIKDGYLAADATWIAEVKNVAKDKEDELKPISIQMFTELTWGKITNKVVAFETELSIDNELQAKKGTSETIDLQQIIKACNAFYQDKLARDDEFYRNSGMEEFSTRLVNESFDGNSFLVRVGRFSGVWSVTLDKYRNPRPPRGRQWGKTKNVADEKYPMGWMKVTALLKS